MDSSALSKRDEKKETENEKAKQAIANKEFEMKTHFDQRMKSDREDFFYLVGMDSEAICQIEKGPLESNLNVEEKKNLLPIPAQQFDRRIFRDEPPLECPFASQHEGKEIISAVVDLPPEIVFNLLFQDPHFMINIYAERKYYDVETSPWETDSNTGELYRKLCYTAVLPSKALGPSTSFVTEIQTVVAVGKNLDMFIVNSEVTNSGIPYEDNFKLYVHYCILNGPPRFVQPGATPATRFVYYALVKFKKNTFFVVKNLIDKSVIAGTEVVAKDILTGLLAHANQGAGVGVKRKRKDDSNKNSLERRSKNKGTEENEGKSPFGVKVLSSILFLLLVIIGGLNVYLYKRLIVLEDSKIYLTTFKHSAEINSPEIEKGKLKLDFFIEEQERMMSWYNEQWDSHIKESLQAVKTAEAILSSAITTLPAYEAQRKRFLSQWEEFLQTLQNTPSSDDASDSIDQIADDLRRHQKIPQLSNPPRFRQ